MLALLLNAWFYLFTEKLLHLHSGMRQITGCPLSINTSSVLYSKFIRYVLYRRLDLKYIFNQSQYFLCRMINRQLIISHLSYMYLAWLERVCKIVKIVGLLVNMSM